MANPLKALFNSSGVVIGLSELTSSDKLPIANIPTGTGSNQVATGDHTHASLSGNASTATRLQTGRKISGVSFDGTSDVTVPYSGLSGLPTLGTAASKSVSGTGNAGATEIVMGNDTRLSVVTTSSPGIMSSADKVKLDSVQVGANSKFMPYTVSDGTVVNVPLV